jgi:hypothetical protein
MQGIWYGDRRDRVKWGALVWLADTFGARHIVQVAYFRGGTKPVLHTPKGKAEIADSVWNHFSELSNIQALAKSTNTKIDVISEVFDHRERRGYGQLVLGRLQQIPSPRIVFLDPDTGIEPGSAKAEHVTVADMREIWSVLQPDDILTVYQHADRSSLWLKKRASKLSKACGGIKAEVIRSRSIAQDVAMLWCRKV